MQRKEIRQVCTSARSYLLQKAMRAARTRVLAADRARYRYTAVFCFTASARVVSTSKKCSTVIDHAAVASSFAAVGIELGCVGLGRWVCRSVGSYAFTSIYLLVASVQVSNDNHCGRSVFAGWRVRYCLGRAWCVLATSIA